MGEEIMSTTPSTAYRFHSFFYTHIKRYSELLRGGCGWLFWCAHILTCVPINTFPKSITKTRKTRQGQTFMGDLWTWEQCKHLYTLDECVILSFESVSKMRFDFYSSASAFNFLKYGQKTHFKNVSFLWNMDKYIMLFEQILLASQSMNSIHHKGKQVSH